MYITTPTQALARFLPQNRGEYCIALVFIFGIILPSCFCNYSPAWLLKLPVSGIKPSVHLSSILQGFPQWEPRVPQAPLASSALHTRTAKAYCSAQPLFCPLRYLDNFTIISLKKPSFDLGLFHQPPSAEVWSILFPLFNLPNSSCKSHRVF